VPTAFVHLHYIMSPAPSLSPDPGFAAPAALRAVSPRQAKPHAPLRIAAVLCLCDFFALCVCVFLGFTLWRLVNPAIPQLHLPILLIPMGALVVFGFAGMYPGTGLTAVQHIRSYARSITLAYLLLTAVMVFSRQMVAESRGAVVVAWALSLVVAPLGRWLVSHLLADRPWSSAPAVVIGSGEIASMVIRNLLDNRVLGYRPVACIDDKPGIYTSCEGVPMVGCLDDAAFVAKEYQIKYAIVAVPDMSREDLIEHLRSWTQVFPHILMVSNLAGMTSLWAQPRDLGGIMGLEIRQNLLNPWNQRIKRAMDILVSGAGLLLAAPVLIGVAVWIRRVSPGNPFYLQEREGRGGRTLRILKLRTMFPDAETLLKQHLASDASARLEWDRFCKLKRDPRILPGVGQFLRRTSLDELPQLWNIFKGDMSLVGPRPFPGYHNSRFDPEFRSLRTRVTPGLTGLWQVSARSDGDIRVQTALDSYYIRNWSLWLDLYILIRTIRAVLACNGAY
jgi:Undecaprenyl-phosphate galactose phosphotransferase WbaP